VDCPDGLHRTEFSHKSVRQGAGAGLENAPEESKQGASGVVMGWIIHLDNMAGISIFDRPEEALPLQLGMPMNGGP
jgi:hypothetical protein